MKILMLYPKYPEETFWNAKEATWIFDRRRGHIPPLGLMTIASYFPEDFEIKLVDRNIDEETEADWEWADVVFLSLMSAQLLDYEKCLQNAKARQKMIAVGGPFTHAYPDRVLHEADWVCYGEAESIMEQFINDLRERKTGIKYQGGNKTNMEEVKTPRFDLLKNINDYGVMAVQFSRGCPFTCEFCDIIEIYGRVPRTKSPDQVIREFTYLKELGFTGTVFIVDDNFIGNKKKAKAMLTELAVWNKKNSSGYRVLTEASINLSDDDELMKKMAEANMNMVFIGLETPDPKLLKTTKKLQNIPGNPLDRLKKIRSHGIHIMAGFIVGFDGEDRDIFEMQKKFIQASGIGVSMVGMLVSLPHTQLSRRLKKEGRLLDKLVPMNQTVEGINYIPKGEMTKREYLEKYADYVREVFEPNAYYERILPAIMSLPKEATSFRVDFGTFLKDMSNFSRHIYHLGFKEKGSRWLYWKSLFTLLWKTPHSVYFFVVDTFYHYHLSRHSKFVHKKINEYLNNPDPDDILDEVIREEEFKEDKVANG